MPFLIPYIYLSSPDINSIHHDFVDIVLAFNTSDKVFDMIESFVDICGEKSKATSIRSKVGTYRVWALKIKILMYCTHGFVLAGSIVVGKREKHVEVILCIVQEQIALFQRKGRFISRKWLRHNEEFIRKRQFDTRSKRQYVVQKHWLDCR